jgi:hypothetical protein
MRRLLGAAVIGALVLGAAGCSTDKSDLGAPSTPSVPPPVSAPVPPPDVSVPPAATASATTSVNPGDAALSADTQALCRQAARMSGQFSSQLAADAKMVTAAGRAADQAAVAEAKRKTARDAQSFAFALNDMSKLVADPTLKKALVEMSAQVRAANGDVRKLDRLQPTLAGACGS